MLKRINKRKWLFTAGLMLAIVAIGLLSGCGDMATGPTSGSDTPVIVGNTGKGQDGTAANGGTSQAGVVRQLLNVVEETTTEVVGLLGGTVDVVVSSGQTKLLVPFGAVDGAVEIEMSVTQTQVRGRYFTEYEFGPHGLEFNKATTLSLALPYANGTMVSLRWFNPDSGQWELQQVKSVRNGRVEFSVYHFSKYGIS